jgi:hypothetical protein
MQSRTSTGKRSRGHIREPVHKFLAMKGGGMTKDFAAVPVPLMRRKR